MIEEEEAASSFSSLNRLVTNDFLKNIESKMGA